MTERDIAFNLLRSAIDGQPPYLGTKPIGANVWWSVFRLLQHNHVAALASLALEHIDDLPRKVKIPWLAEREKAANWHRYQLDVQQDIVDHMSRHSIETLVLKGTHTAQYYPVPELREFGDLDLYFQRHKEADAVAQSEMGVEINHGSHHHTKYAYRGVTVESHCNFVNCHYPPSNRHYEQLLEPMAPSATFEVLFLLRHMAGHFAASRITLRDVVDWYLTCRTLNNDVDWDTVLETTKDFGMTDFAQALCSIVEHRFGYKIPLAFEGGPEGSINRNMVEEDIIYGDASSADKGLDGIGRLAWKLGRYRAMGWKRRMVFNDKPLLLLISSITSHAEKPQSILHKQ